MRRHAILAFAVLALPSPALAAPNVFWPFGFFSDKSHNGSGEFSENDRISQSLAIKDRPGAPATAHGGPSGDGLPIAGQVTDAYIQEEKASALVAGRLASAPVNRWRL